ncbi:hypothetical protein KP509_09G021100 [Ceratopteris richardii]|uniref:Uncharacterized protein n=1 Tax=Ceratopteris richardii TaxID=49495 RepID=A0A8T2U612_CERRI|nr:hypothetical protein KP509_09G021100 [Ceratopteris richardii]
MKQTSALRLVTWVLLVLNLCLYVIVAALAGWVLNIMISGNLQSVTAAFMATADLIIFSLISAAAGLGSAIMGFHHMHAWSLESFSATAAAAGVALLLSLEALGIASKEITVGLYRHANLKALEALAITAGTTQLFYVVILQVAKVRGEFS